MRILAFLSLFCTIHLSAQHQEYLDIGNVKALVNSNGVLFHDSSSNRGSFEVPKGDSTHTIYASAFWMSGTNSIGGLINSAYGYDRYSNYNLIHTGPVDIVNQNRDTSSNLQRVWKINKSDVDYHIANWNSTSYQIPNSILDWPGNGTNNTAKVLAPFYDLNRDSIYQPQLGEYPLIKGDQAIFVIANNFSPSVDSLPNIVPRRDSSGALIGIDTLPSMYSTGSTQIEMHLMLYAYNNQHSHIENTVFVNVKLFNRSLNSNGDLKDFKFSVFSDPDVGNVNDDFVGTDTARNMYYGYNADSFDESTTRTKGYGQNLACQGVLFLNKNIEASILDPNWLQLGYVEQPFHLRQMQKGSWYNRPLFYGGNGYTTCIDTSRKVTIYCDGNLLNYQLASEWTELNSCPSDTSLNNLSGDRRIIGTPNLKSQFNHDTSIEFDYAYVFAQDTGGVVASVAALQIAADSVQAFYDRNRFVGISENQKAANLEFGIYPNPATEEVFIETTENSFSIQVVNAKGQVIRKATNVRRLNISAIANGFYFVRISTPSKIGVKKLIIK